MTARDCALIGRWHIVESTCGRRDDFDPLGPARIAFDGDGHGKITVGALTAALRLEYAGTTVFFRWHRSDEMTDVTGEGSAELRDYGTIEIGFAYHDGGDAILKAIRKPTSSSTC